LHICFKMVGLQEYVDRKAEDFLEIMRGAKSHKEFSNDYKLFEKILSLVEGVGADERDYFQQAVSIENRYLEKFIGKMLGGTH
jgi:hypothetical protein